MTTVTSAGPEAGRALLRSADPRAVRTRDKLVDAFQRLAASEDAGDITVATLTAAAGVHRSVFYKHFASTEDLSVHLLRDLFGVIRDADVMMRTELGVGGLRASRAAMSDVVRFIGARRATYAPLLGASAPSGAVRIITDAFAELTAEALERMPVRPVGVDPQIASRFLAHGVIGIVGRWLDDPRTTLTDADVVDQLVQCFPSWLVEAPEPSDDHPQTTPPQR